MRKKNCRHSRTGYHPGLRLVWGIQSFENEILHLDFVWLSPLIWALRGTCLFCKDKRPVESKSILRSWSCERSKDIRHGCFGFGTRSRAHRPAVTMQTGTGRGKATGLHALRAPRGIRCRATATESRRRWSRPDGDPRGAAGPGLQPAGGRPGALGAGRRSPLSWQPPPPPPPWPLTRRRPIAAVGCPGRRWLVAGTGGAGSPMRPDGGSPLKAVARFYAKPLAVARYHRTRKRRGHWLEPLDELTNLMKRWAFSTEAASLSGRCWYQTNAKGSSAYVWILARSMSTVGVSIWSRAITPELSGSRPMLDVTPARTY